MSNLRNKCLINICHANSKTKKKNNAASIKFFVCPVLYLGFCYRCLVLPLYATHYMYLSKILIYIYILKIYLHKYEYIVSYLIKFLSKPKSNGFK